MNKTQLKQVIQEEFQQLLENSRGIQDVKKRRRVANDSGNDHTLEEGVFGDIFGVSKLSKECTSIIQKSQKYMVKGDPESLRVWFSKLMPELLGTIKKAKISDHMKNTFKESMLGSVFLNIKAVAPDLSGDEIKKKLNIPDDLYRKMVIAVAKQATNR